MFKDVGSRIWDKIMELSIFNRSYLDNYSELFKKLVFLERDLAGSSETIVMNNLSCTFRKRFPKFFVGNSVGIGIASEFPSEKGDFRPFPKRKFRSNFSESKSEIGKKQKFC